MIFQCSFHAFVSSYHSLSGENCHEESREGSHEKAQDEGGLRAKIVCWVEFNCFLTANTLDYAGSACQKVCLQNQGQECSGMPVPMMNVT